MSPSAWSTLWKYGPMIYAPTLLYAIGQGALIPMLPVIAVEMGASIPLAGFIAVLVVIGQVIGNAPAGACVNYLGERKTMIAAGSVGLTSLGGVALAPNLLLLGISVLILGCCASAFGLARHAFLTTRVPYQLRARALSLLGGMFRFGAFAGPLLTAALLFLTEQQLAPVYAFGFLLLVTVTLVIFGPDPEASASHTPHTLAGDPSQKRQEPKTHPRSTQDGFFATIRHYRSILATLGMAAAAMSAVRSARQVALPLWALSIGLDAGTIAVVLGTVGAIEFAMFYVGGQIMDRYGRIWTALPSMALISAGLLVLSFTQTFSHAEIWFVGCAALIALGNGLSSGTLLTVGSDIAPRTHPAPFLGAWRTIIDSGGAIAPAIFSGIIAIGSISVATASLGLIGVAGAIGFWRWMPRQKPMSDTDPDAIAGA